MNQVKQVNQVNQAKQVNQVEQVNQLKQVNQVFIFIIISKGIFTHQSHISQVGERSLTDVHHFLSVL